MKTLLIITTLLLIGCDMLMLEAEDPQDPANDQGGHIIDTVDMKENDDDT